LIETYLRARSPLVQGHHRVHSRRPARRQVRRYEGDEEQQGDRHVNVSGSWGATPYNRLAIMRDPT
jgi:hypothetical protein